MPVARRVLVAGAGAALTALTVLLLVEHRQPLGVDADLHAWMLAHRRPPLTMVAVVVTDTGTGVPAYLLAALAGTGLAGRLRVGRWTAAAVGALALLAAQGVRLLLATAIGRVRPPAADWAASAGGASYPSGHTTTSAVVAGLLCLAAASALPGVRGRLVQALALVWAGAVGLTRVYLGVHWPTDVVAGWLLAAVLVVTAGPLLARRR